MAIKLAGTWGFKSGSSMPATARNHLRRSQLLSAVDSTKISQNHCTFIGEALPRLVSIQNNCEFLLFCSRHQAHAFSKANPRKPAFPRIDPADCKTFLRSRSHLIAIDEFMRALSSRCPVQLSLFVATPYYRERESRIPPSSCQARPPQGARIARVVQGRLPQAHRLLRSCSPRCCW